jgi:DNA-binding transcriptional ArsR family regulator
MALREWVKLPTGWICGGGLTAFRWDPGKGSDNVAALMTLTAIAHHADAVTGLSRLTYEHMATITGLSRAKISGGLDVLAERGIIRRNDDGRSVFRLTDYDPDKGWAKLPAKRLHQSGSIHAFADFRLRRSAELNALKLYFLFVAFRDNQSNMANISYDKIEEYTSIDRARIKGGLSVLATTGLVYVEHLPKIDGHVYNAYRLPQLDPYTHMGTTNRGTTAADVSDRLAAATRAEPPTPATQVTGAERAAELRSRLQREL